MAGILAALYNRFVNALSFWSECLKIAQLLNAGIDSPATEIVA